APIAKPIPPVFAFFGTDDFLRRTCIQHLLHGSELGSESIRSYDGEDSQWRDVHDQLATRSLFDDLGARCAIARRADSMVSKAKDLVEKWIDSAPSDTLLVLEQSYIPRSEKRGSWSNARRRRNHRGVTHRMTKPLPLG
ncbi:MAG: hypothetical protein MUC43_00590, partial [Pirellula sp.]|nr:hypothetical protein [Pirellula sp.]